MWGSMHPLYIASLEGIGQVMNTWLALDTGGHSYAQPW
jgi:hypothetical protein